MTTPAERTRKRRRVLFPTTPQALSTQVSQLRRVVYSNRPEVRQASYDITISVGQLTATPLIQPTLIDAGTEEIKLHRIAVCHSYVAGDAPWGIIYSPRQGYSENQLPNGGDAYALQNFLQHLDHTKQRVFLRKNMSYLVESAASSDEIFEFDRRFSIPMKVGMVNPGSMTVNHNQLFFIGGLRDATVPKVLSVTVWYTSA